LYNFACMRWESGRPLRTYLFLDLEGFR
jgi:hypothetical protein